MNGLTRPSVEAGGFAWLAVGAVEVGAEGIAADGGAGAGAGALAELAGGVEDVDAAGGDAGVCASAPETSRGSPRSAPVNKVRSIMRQNPKP
jgi:hypothetical protein